jgi:hypothetical protein
MQDLKESVLSSFRDDDLDRVDKYIDTVRDSLKSTNSKFGAYTLLLIISLVSYHFYVYGYLRHISIFGLEISDLDLIKKWFLIIPSTVFALSTSIGYLRVYQQESIEWLLAKYRPKEYASGIYRLTFPSSYILGLDVLRRRTSKIERSIALIISVPLIFATTIAPVWYISWAYSNTFAELGANGGLIISVCISALLLLAGFAMIFQSQRI